MPVAREEQVLSDLIFEEVPAEIRRTLTPDQRIAIRKAIAGRKKHAIDLRFTLQLPFTKLYFVFLVGKDTRTASTDVARDRRATARMRSARLGLLALCCVVFIVLAAAGYLIKCIAGVDLFPWHLRDVLPIPS